MSAPFMRQGYQPLDDDYYIILDVDFRATQEEIARAYRRLAQKYHPDKNNQDDRSRKEAQALFEKIKTAYDVLKDPRKRQVYDTLGPDGVKLELWKVTKKQMTAKEIREEYLRLSEQNFDQKISRLAKPHSSFTLGLDFSELFRDDTKVDEYEFDSELLALIARLSLIDINSISCLMSVESNLALKHRVTYEGQLESSNGLGSGAFITKYKYNFSKRNNLAFALRFGNNPLINLGYTHELSPRTLVRVEEFVLLTSDFQYGSELELTHRIRDYLVGKVSIREGLGSSVKTTLIYINEKLALELSTSYKLGKIHQTWMTELGYRFNNNESKLSITVSASTKEGLAIDYGCTTTFFEINVLGAAISFSVPSGVTLKLRLIRARQEFNLPIYLSDEVQAAPIFYGTMVPLIGFYILNRYYLKSKD